MSFTPELSTVEEDENWTFEPDLVDGAFGEEKCSGSCSDSSDEGEGGLLFHNIFGQNFLSLTLSDNHFYQFGLIFPTVKLLSDNQFCSFINTSPLKFHSFKKGLRPLCQIFCISWSPTPRPFVIGIYQEQYLKPSKFNTQNFVSLQSNRVF